MPIWHSLHSQKHIASYRPLLRVLCVLFDGLAVTGSLGLAACHAKVLHVMVMLTCLPTRRIAK